MTKKKTPVKKPIKTKPMTAAQKRVAIAADTIRWLDSRAIKMKPGTYFDLPRRAIKLKNSEDKLDVALETMQKACQVCALGGMFYSMVRRFDKVSVGIASTESMNDGTDYLSSVQGGDIYTELGEYFPHHQLALIESAFEMRDMTEWEDYDGIERYRLGELDEVIDRATEFSPKTKPADRLRAIMKNIVSNNGMFRP